MSGFGGETYDEDRDGERLRTQLRRVYGYMSDGDWHRLSEIADACRGSEAAVSARLRDLRKDRFGGHIVERQYLRDGLWVYRLIPAGSQLALPV